MLWFSSDQHFGHQRICELSGRPFSSVEEMNEALVDNWNNLVSADDYVIVLGDFAMGQISETLPIAKRLNGDKYLVPGNHDRCSTAYQHRRGLQPERRQMYLDAGFYLLPEVTTESFGGVTFTLCHFPYAGDHTEQERFLDHRPEDVGNWLLHGHVHEAWQVRDKMINVGVDVWDFQPVSVGEILRIVGDGS